MEHIASVAAFMTKPPLVLYPDMEIGDAILFLLNHRISGAPVVASRADSRTVVGVISEKDCLGVLTNDAYHDLPRTGVDHYMTKDVKSVPSEMGIFSVADIFLSSCYRRLPVIDDGVLVGVVSRRDVLNAAKRQWRNMHAAPAREPSLLTDRVKAKLGASGVPQLRRELD